MIAVEFVLALLGAASAMFIVLVALFASMATLYGHWQTGMWWWDESEGPFR